MEAIDKIYVASFVQNNIFDYGAINEAFISWWAEKYGAGHKIEKGSILKVDNYISSEYINSSYLIAKEDYTITGDGDVFYLSIPVTFDEQSNPIVDVESSLRQSNCIWESCSPENRYATDKPWTLKTEGVVTDYISFQWNDKYNEPGTFSLTLVATDENVSLFQEDRYLLIGESNHVMLVEHIEFNNNLKADGYILQVTGRSIECILERRIAFPGQGLSTEEYKGNDGLRKAIYDLVYNFFMHPENIAKESSDGQKFFYYPERRVPFMTLPTEEEKEALIKRPFRASVNKSVSKENLLTIIQDLCKQTDLGFKMEIVPLYGNSRCLQWIFSLYTGDDKSYNRKDKSKPLLIFAPKLGNVEAVSTVKDYSEYRNAIFCGVEKDSDGYIDLMKDVSEANYFGEKTGVDIIDSINTNATKLITGVKNTLTTKLEASPICYTGILFLAVAAMRNDKDYTPTVTRIYKKGSNYTEMYCEQDGISWKNDDDNLKYSISYNSPMYITAYTDVTKVGSSYNVGGKSAIPIYFYRVRQNRFYDLAICPIYGLKTNQIAIPWNNNKYLICDVEYGSNVNSETKETSEFGLIKPKRYTNTTISGYDSRSVPFFSYSTVNPDDKVGEVVIQIHPVTNQDEEISTYPSEYIEKEDADNIYIVYRHAFGDTQDTYSSKTDEFRLAAVNPASVDPNNTPVELDFKSSTSHGWLTTPILRQAISDLNNSTFSKYTGTFKKSALQLWFKTLDKYTDSSNQKRWLCQEYVSESNKTGLERREVFVEEDKSDQNDWNASKINQWQSSLITLTVDQEEDEESDEEVNKRLMETARKRSGDYRRRRDVDASLYLDNYTYLPDDPNDPMGYNLGDIIQVDDGWGNMDKYIISGVTLSMDTTSGPKIVPTFDRYEYLPKQYHQLEYLQVANMILPVKFNPRPVSGVSSASELRLGANVYFGALDTDRNTEISQNEELGGISDIWSESQISFTEIEADLSYSQKTETSGETPPEYKHIFALISAIGADHYKPIDENDSNFDLNIPFALIQTTYKSPYLFMSEPDNANSNYGYVSQGSINPNHLYLIMGNGCRKYDDQEGIEYLMGCGYSNKYINGSIDDYEDLREYIYYKDLSLSEIGLPKHYIINRIESRHPKYMYDTDTVSEFNNKNMYYSVSKCGETILSDRPFAKNYYPKTMIFQNYGEEQDRWPFDYIYIEFYIVTSPGHVETGDTVYLKFRNGWAQSYGRDNHKKSLYMDYYGNTYIPPSGTVLKLKMYDTLDDAIEQNSNHKDFYFESFFPYDSIEIPNTGTTPNEHSYIRVGDSSIESNYIVPIKWPTDVAIPNRYYIGLYYDKTNIGLYLYGDTTCPGFINSSCIIERLIGSADRYSVVDSNSGNKLFTMLDSDLIPSNLAKNNFTIDKSYWGQDNYRYPTNYESIDDLYNDLDLENNIVLGGIGYYAWDNEKEDYTLRFDEETSQTISISPRGCDASNGVRVYSLKIYEVDGASRYVEFGNSPMAIVNNDTVNMRMKVSDHLAFYPNLGSRKLIHEYVPVIYVDAGEETLETEKYGLYDLIDQEFVPINYAYNSYATFIEAGGEISNND